MVNSMARKRKGSKSSKPRKNNAISISRGAEALIVGSAITNATLGGNIVEVLTGRFDGSYNPGADGGQRISIPEILGFTKSGWKAENVGGTYGSKFATSFTNAVWENFKANGMKSFVTITATPIVFRVLRKQARPFTRMFNKLMRDVSLPVRF